LGSLSEGSAVGLLAYEGERSRLKLGGHTLEALGRAGEIAAAEVAGAGRRPVRGVRDADAQPEELVLLLGIEQSRCEARLV
jgi:hypothetical protein